VATSHAFLIFLKTGAQDMRRLRQMNSSPHPWGLFGFAYISLARKATWPGSRARRSSPSLTRTGFCGGTCRLRVRIVL